MKRLRHISTAALLATLALIAAQVSAQESNSTQRSFLTFSGPVELPGITLDAGTYEFRLGNTETSRNIVQVFTKEGREPVGQWTFAPAEREKTSDETMVMFRESREGTTPAVQYWYFPGERIGKEFIYPKDQAQRIAARTGQTVQSSDGPVKTETAANAPAAAEPALAANRNESGEPVESPAAPARSEPSEQAQAALRDAPASSQPSAPAGSTTGNRGVIGQAAQADAERSSEQARAESAAPAFPAPAPIAEPEPSLEARAEVSPFVEPAPRPVGTSGAAAAEPQPAGTSGQVEAEPARQLPATASPLPLAALIGLLSLAGAAGIRALRS